jgi:metallophosphoesterase superfamily enzyme
MNDIKKNFNPNNILIIGDLHCPFEAPGYLTFCQETQEKFDCGTVIFIGDLFDFHAMSYHESDPDGFSGGREYEKAIEAIKWWQVAFPDAIITVGNHDLIPHRKAYTHGVPSRLTPTFQQIFDAPPGWKFAKRFTLYNILFIHGTNNAKSRAQQTRMSVVQGHLHSEHSVQWWQSDLDRIFAMQVGCGVDNDSYAMRYGRDFAKRPVLGCGVVLDSGKIPLVVPMFADSTVDKLNIWID